MPLKSINSLKLFRLPPPPVMWAQRRDVLFVTICLEDCKDPVIKTEPEMIYFKGVGGTEQKMHELTINLYNKIVPNKTVQSLRGRTIELVLPKETDAPYWPRLTKEKTKAHWLKTDFNKWKDEVYSDDDSNMKDGKELEEVTTYLFLIGRKYYYKNLRSISLA